MLNKLFSGCLLKLLLCVFLISCSSANYNWQGKAAPLLRFTDQNGDYRSLEDFRGEHVGVIVWATWCHKSKKLLRDLSQFISKNRDFRLITISVDPQTQYDRWLNLVKENKLDGLVNCFSGNDTRDEAVEMLKIKEIPQVYLISPDFEVIAQGDDLSILRK
ncbi:MAG TPA: TlpA disulfide reductase family protein [Oligoflexia bacterium]|nr:TlpA disulfide reductase family protein [Oligoflexia bacterium]HMP27488.1 TlpA disulfide reductase family protein [Oligoflexia bacterium]